MRKVILFLFVASTMHSGALPQKYQPPSTFTDDDTIHYKKEAIAFIMEVKGDELLTDSLILSSKPIDIQKGQNGCSVSDLLADTAFFLPEELVYLKKVAYPVFKRWTSAEFPNVKLIRHNKIFHFFNHDIMNGWKQFHEKYGPGYVEFSSPIFFRNYTYCFLYDAFYRNGLYAKGQLVLYKKVYGKWVEIKLYDFWVS